MPEDLLKHRPVKLDLPAALANIRREGTPGRVFYFEHGEEPAIKQQLCDRYGLTEGLDPDDPRFVLRREIRLKEFLGHEVLRVFPGGIVWQGLPCSTTAAPPAVGPIRSRRDVET